MVLASDGIWNVKKCQQVIDFLRPKVLSGEGKLSEAIEEVVVFLDNVCNRIIINLYFVAV